jgi:hypothetical protein
MGRRTFAARSETFGFETDRPWALAAFRLLFNVPRAYKPLVDAWDAKHPGTRRAIDQLVDRGFVSYQPGVVVDTRTGTVAAAEGRKVVRWRATAKGKRALASYVEDLRVFEDEHRHLRPGGAATAIALLASFDLDSVRGRFGVSVPHAIAEAGIEERLGRWWVRRFADAGYIVQLDRKIADVREVIPPHWRITRPLCRQLDDVLSEFGAGHLKAEFRLQRSRFLADVDPARISLTGATDFDHDVESQNVVAAMLRSPRWFGGGIFSIEPRILLPVDDTTRPWSFAGSGGHHVFYQPDAELRGSDDDDDGRARVRRFVVEYERFQSRRDAWSHIERFLGYLHTRAVVGESAALLFIVDSDARRRGYVELVEAFADYTIDDPGVLPANPVVLAVSSVPRVLTSSDALNLREWSRIQLPGRADTGGRPVLHPPEAGPYDTYFGRT